MEGGLFGCGSTTQAAMCVETVAGPVRTGGWEGRQVALSTWQDSLVTIATTKGLM